jgi:hypothetical protein
MNGPKLVTATFSNKPVLTVLKAGSGGGTVTSTPAGVDCGADCTEPYTAGTTVTLTAVEGQNSVFIGWNGCTVGSDPMTCSVTMDASKSVTATFDAKPVLTVLLEPSTTTATVTSEDGGINCPSDCTQTYDPNDSVSLHALGPPGQFVGWTGGCVGSDPDVCTVLMDSTKSVTATFSE